MNLREFITNYVAHNTLVRVWKKEGGCHRLLGNGPSMEWEILKGKVEESKYLDNKVKHVTDILCENYHEAVNIVIEI